MKQVSNGYKNQIKQMGREIDSIITYYNHYKMIAENNKYILTEDGEKINTEQINSSSYVEIGAEDIFSSKVIIHGGLLKTMMKEFDFEIRQDMNVGSIVSYKFGVKVNGTYEYVDLGTYIVQEKEYNEDSHTFSYKSYDIMLKSMIPYKDTATYPITLYGLLNSVLEYCGIEIGVTEFPNSERGIYDNPFNGMDITCRDALDFITEVTGCSSYIQDGVFIINGPSDTNLTLTEDSFKNTNVKFNKTYGPINSILFSRSEDTDIVEIKDDTSIEQNGVTQIKIKDNPLLEGNDRSDYFQEMFNILNGLTYSINDLSSIGITYLDYMDLFDVSIGNNTYQCLLLNDEINIEQGLEEIIFTNELEETEQEYRTSRLSDKDQKWANIQVKKDIGEISIEVGEKVGKDEIISSINLTPETATINANKININGTISANGNFKVDTSGTMECNQAIMKNATMKDDYGTLTLNHGIMNLNDTYNPKWADFTAQVGMSGISCRTLTGSGSILIPKYVYLLGEEDYGSIDDFYSYFQMGSMVNGSITEDRIKMYGRNGNITCVSLTQTSKEEEKKNFKKLENALDIVKDVDIYEYNLKFEEDKDKKHIGFVIGDNYKYRKEITSSENDGVDLYSMVSVLWQAVKEQQQEIEELRKLVNK